MELHIKKYNELTSDELYEILKVRSEVFVVEQNCPYQDLDGKDKKSYHMYFTEKGKIAAYLRVIEKGASFNEASIGRVLSLKRRCGLASKLLCEAISLARDRLSADKIVLEAQVYAKSLYEKLGFYQVGDEFSEDGIPHIKMVLDIEKK